MKQIKFLLILVGLSLSGCSLFFGISNLEPQTTDSVIKYARKVGYITNEQFYFIDSSKIEEIWRGAFPKAFIYNSSGELVQHLSCFATGPDDLEWFFSKSNHSAVNDTIKHLLGSDTIINIAPKFDKLKNNIYSNGGKVEFPVSKYYVLYFWSKSFGKINKKIAVPMEQYIINHPEYASSFIKINCDYMKSWGVTKKDIN
jgi:hypothetical protein